MKKYKIFCFDIALAMFVFLFGACQPVMALTPAELQTAINQIVQQIASLQAQLAQMQNQQSVGGQWCHTFNINLGFANSGNSEVGELHTVLQREGILYGSDGTFIYSEDTAAAVVRLQAKYGIVQTGYVGSLTRARLNALYACGVSNSGTQNTGSPVCSNLWWYDNNNRVCSQKQFCDLYMYYGLNTFYTQTDCQISLNGNSNLPSVSITSPNGGEIWHNGSTAWINWNSRNVSNVYIKLRKGGDTYQGNEGAISGTIANSGAFAWRIPDTLPTGSDYSIKVIDADSLIEDISDSFFRISSSVNNPPFANAGSDLAINENTTVALDSTGSYDPEGTPLLFSWACNGGILSNSNIPVPIFTAPNVNVDTTFSCILTVRDEENLSAVDSVNILVRNSLCKGEGESIPVIASPPSCCSGLMLISPKTAGTMGSHGICTAKCGNGVCDSFSETNYNCPQDCH